MTNTVEILDKVETYSSNVLQNSLTDAGFCQARGVVSGRITYGTGSSVEDVRLTLRASDSGESNTVRGYSQRFDGASTGIVWQADSAATAKVFGPDKNFTVQMFVRPDDNLADGAEEEIGIFEIAEQREVDDHAEGYHPLGSAFAPFVA